MQVPSQLSNKSLFHTTLSILTRDIENFAKRCKGGIFSLLHYISRHKDTRVTDRSMSAPTEESDKVKIIKPTGDNKKKNSSSKKEPLRRPRGRRGGVKNPNKAKSSAATDATKSIKGKEVAAPTPHSLLIAAFHTIEKKLAQTTDKAERKKLLDEKEMLGGLKAYQDASLLGADKRKGGESGKWITQGLKVVLGEERRDIKLLDVGSLSGTAFDKYPWIKATSIDINPRGDKVQQIDFFDLPIPASEEERFDVVSLSLVVNFIGDIQDRGRILVHAHKYVVKGGYMALILPLACVENSRYCTQDRLEGILASTGWKIAHQDK